jgi:hypothetical protein
VKRIKPEAFLLAHGGNLRIRMGVEMSCDGMTVRCGRPGIMHKVSLNGLYAAITRLVCRDDP